MLHARGKNMDAKVTRAGRRGKGISLYVLHHRAGQGKVCADENVTTYFIPARSTACVCMCVYMCVHVCIYVCMYVCVYMCVCMCVFMCVYVCVYMCVYVCVYMCVMCVCMCVYMCVYVCIYINNITYIMCVCKKKSHFDLCIPTHSCAHHAEQLLHMLFDIDVWLCGCE